MAPWGGWELGRTVVAFTAVLYAGMWVQLSLMHWCGGFKHRAVWAPVLATPVLVGFRWPLPLPFVTFSYGENEQAMRAEMHRLGTAILQAAGAQRAVISEGNDQTMGGSRMGSDPRSSVVDRNLRTWDHPNLYISDASVFVSPGGAQRSQTIMSLATRLADHLDSSHPKEAP
jgi:choline dehydrogenase-like flavoprotein